MVVDTATLEVVHRLQFSRQECFKAHQVLPLPGEREAAVVCEGNWPTERGTVVRVDLDAEKGPSISRVVDVGYYPDAVALAGRR